MNNSFIETEPYEKGFAEYYEKNIKPHTEAFENHRIEAVRKAKHNVTISLLLTIVQAGMIAFITIYFKSKDQTLQMSIFIATVFGVGLLLSWHHSLKDRTDNNIDDYILSVKSDIFPKIIAFLGNFEYHPKCNNMVLELKYSDIISDYDLEISEDNIKGKYKDVEINLFETSLLNKICTSRGQPVYRNVFNGIVIKLSMNKKFYYRTIIIEHNNLISSWLKKMFLDLKNVELEDPEFKKIFTVYSNNQIEARYLLTTSFMVRMINLYAIFNNTPIRCSFYDSSLLIMISTRQNFFKTNSTYETVNFAKDAKNLLKEMNIIFEIIDVLKLNQNIGI